MPLDIFSIDGAGLKVENYIYMYHLQEFIVLPSFIDSVQENFHIQWQQTTPLGRSAPIYSFQSAGPRTLQMTFLLHRDMMYQINKDVSNAKLAVGDDYVDTLIKDLQACVLPDYDGTAKAVNPPVVAMRVGQDLFIKGVITSDLGITWTYPILSNGKYSNITISFTISEIDPYDARTARKVGSYRNVSTNLDYSNVYDVAESPEVTETSFAEANLSKEDFVAYMRNAGLGDMNLIWGLWQDYLQGGHEWEKYISSSVVIVDGGTSTATSTANNHGMYTDSGSEVVKPGATGTSNVTVKQSDTGTGNSVGTATGGGGTAGGGAGRR